MITVWVAVGTEWGNGETEEGRGREASLVCEAISEGLQVARERWMLRIWLAPKKEMRGGKEKLGFFELELRKGAAFTPEAYKQLPRGRSSSPGVLYCEHPTLAGAGQFCSWYVLPMTIRFHLALP